MPTGTFFSCDFNVLKLSVCRRARGNSLQSLLSHTEKGLAPCLIGDLEHRGPLDNSNVKSCWMYMYLAYLRLFGALSCRAFHARVKFLNEMCALTGSQCRSFKTCHACMLGVLVTMCASVFCTLCNFLMSLLGTLYRRKLQDAEPGCG